MNDWHSNDENLYLRIQESGAIFIDSGRISIVSPIDNLSLSDLGSSWFLACSSPDIAMELWTCQEALDISAFLGIPIVKE